MPVKIGYATDNITALKALDTTNFISGYARLVIGEKAWYVYISTSTSVADDISVVAPTGLVGRWFKLDASITSADILDSTLTGRNLLSLVGGTGLLRSVSGVITYDNSTYVTSATAVPTQANNTILGNISGSSASPTGLTGLQVNTLLPTFTRTLNGLVPASGGTTGIDRFLREDGVWFIPAGSGGGSSSPITAFGDLIYGDATGTPVRLTGNITTTKKYLTQTGTGSISAVPVWEDFSIPNTSVTAGSYTNGNFTVGVDGRLSAASNGTASSGIAILNSLISGNQNFATGTSGSDFGINSSASTHTFNLPNSSASARGLLTSTDWTTFNNKQNALSGTGFVKSTAGVISYDSSVYVPTSTIITINGVAQDLLTSRTWTIATTSGGGGGGSGSCDIVWDAIEVSDWDAMAIGDVCADSPGITLRSAGTLIGAVGNSRTLNFVAGATVSDAGAGVINITCTGAGGLTVDASRQSTNTHTISFGDKYFAYTASSSNLIWVVGSRVQCTFNINTYIEAVVIGTNSIGVTVAPYKIIGFGSYSSWVISLAAGGNDGLRSDTTRESTSSVAVGTGTKTFVYTVTSNNIGWIVGTRLRVIYSINPTIYMEGIITIIDGGNVTINSDLNNGSGTYNSWNLSIAGDRGSQGNIGFSTSTSLNLYNYYNLL